MSDLKNEKTTKKTTVSIPVQATILVPVVVDVEVDDLETAVGEEVGTCKFVNLENVANGESIAEQMISKAIGSSVVMDAIQILRSAIAVHQKKHDNKAIFTWCAGIAPEEELLPEEETP